MNNLNSSILLCTPYNYENYPYDEEPVLGCSRMHNRGHFRQYVDNFHKSPDVVVVLTSRNVSSIHLPITEILLQADLLGEPELIQSTFNLNCTTQNPITGNESIFVYRTEDTGVNWITQPVFNLTYSRCLKHFYINLNKQQVVIQLDMLRYKLKIVLPLMLSWHRDYTQYKDMLAQVLPSDQIRAHVFSFLIPCASKGEIYWRNESMGRKTVVLRNRYHVAVEDINDYPEESDDEENFPIYTYEDAVLGCCKMLKIDTNHADKLGKIDGAMSRGKVRQNLGIDIKRCQLNRFYYLMNQMRIEVGLNSWRCEKHTNLDCRIDELVKLYKERVTMADLDSLEQFDPYNLGIEIRLNTDINYMYGEGNKYLNDMLDSLSESKKPVFVDNWVGENNDEKYVCDMELKRVAAKGILHDSDTDKDVAARIMSTLKTTRFITTKVSRVYINGKVWVAGKHAKNNRRVLKNNNYQSTVAREKMFSAAWKTTAERKVREQVDNIISFVYRRGRLTKFRNDFSLRKKLDKRRELAEENTKKEQEEYEEFRKTIHYKVNTLILDEDIYDEGAGDY